MGFIKSLLHEMGNWPRNIKLFFLANVFYQIGTGMFSVLYNLYVQELGYSDAMNGRIVSLQSLATALLFVPIGIWGDKASSRKILAIGALFSGAAFVGRSFAAAPGGLLGLAVFSGLFASFFQVLAIPFLAENISSKNRLRMFSYFSSLVLASQVIGSMGGGVFADVLQSAGFSVLSSLRIVLAIGGTATLAAFVPMLFVQEKAKGTAKLAGQSAGQGTGQKQAEHTVGASGAPEESRPLGASGALETSEVPGVSGNSRVLEASRVSGTGTSRASGTPGASGNSEAPRVLEASRTLRAPVAPGAEPVPAVSGISKSAQAPQENLASEFKMIGRFVAAQLLIGFGSGLVIPYLNLYFVGRFSISLSVMGTLISLGQIMTIVSMLIGPSLAARVGQVKAVIIFQMLSLPFLLLTGFTHWLAVASVSFLFRQALMNAANPIQSAIMIDRVSDKRRGIANSLTQTAFMLGWATMGPVQSYLITEYGNYWGYAITFSITGFLYVSASLLYFFMFRDKKNKRDSSNNALSVL